MHKFYNDILKFTCVLLCLSIAVYPVKSFSQASSESTSYYKDSTTNYIEVIGFGGTTNRTPFWIQANQYGVVSRTTPAGSIRGGIEKFYSLDKKNEWRLGGGVEVVENFTQHGSKLILPQIYGSLRYRNWEFQIGRKKQPLGLADSTLGMGSYAWSGNALPIPRIYIGTRGYVDVPFTKGWVSFTGFYSDGKFEGNRPVTSGLNFHQKALYIRLGKASSILRLYGGFNHQVQWGGKSPYLSSAGNNLPNGFKNYLNVIFGSIGGDGENVTFFDSTSRIGNHLGTIDLAFEVDTYGSTLFFYRQFIYEDGSLFYWKGLKDGLNGVRIRRKNSYGANFEIQEAVLEFLYTKDQGGNDFVIGNGKKRGIDNYFNNQQVRDGWSYYNRTIGTPFIPPTSDTYWKWPNYADNFTSNNRVMVLNIGLRGSLYQKFKWYTKLSYSNNSGSYIVPFEGSPKQFSGLLALQTNLNVLGGVLAKGSFAADIGGLYPKNYGFTLGLRKDFSF